MNKIWVGGASVGLTKDYKVKVIIVVAIWRLQ